MGLLITFAVPEAFALVNHGESFSAFMVALAPARLDPGRRPQEPQLMTAADIAILLIPEVLVLGVLIAAIIIVLRRTQR